MSAAYDLACGLDPKASMAKTSWLVRCPAHDDRSPSLSIRTGEGGTPLIVCHAGCNRLNVIEACKHIGAWPKRQREWTPQRQRQRTKPPPANSPAPDHVERVVGLWAAAQPDLRGTPTERYLTRRGLWTGYDPTSIHPWGAFRFHSDCPFGPRRFPALLVSIRDQNGNFAGLQRIALTDDGRKAPISSPKMSLGPLRSGAARLGDYRTGDELALTEGVEDALAFQQITCIPTWAACGARVVKHIVLPDRIRRVLVVADADSAGMEAASQALAAFEEQGRSVRPRSASSAASLASTGRTIRP